MNKVFLGGSRKLPRLNSAIRAELRKLMADEHLVLVGDAAGADKAVQTFFAEEGYRDVVVYCMDGLCRNNVGGWEVHPVDSGGKRRGFDYFAMKDAEMSRDADNGFMFWDGKSRGTLNNVWNLLRQEKATRIYLSPSKSFRTVKSIADFQALLAGCDAGVRSCFDKTIKRSSRTQSRQTALDIA